MIDNFEQLKLNRERAVMCDDALLKENNPSRGFFLRINAAQCLEDLYVNSSGSRLFMLDVIFLRCRQGVINQDTALGKIRHVVNRMVELGLVTEMKAKIEEFKTNRVQDGYILNYLDRLITEYTGEKINVPLRTAVARKVRQLLRCLHVKRGFKKRVRPRPVNHIQAPRSQRSSNKPQKRSKPLVRPSLGVTAISLAFLAGIGGLYFKKIQKDTEDAVREIMPLVESGVGGDNDEGDSSFVDENSNTRESVYPDVEIAPEINPKRYNFKVVTNEILDKYLTIEEWKKEGWLVFNEWELDDEEWGIEKSEDDFSDPGYILENPNNNEHYFIKNLELRPGKDTIVGVQIFPKSEKTHANTKKSRSSKPDKNRKDSKSPKYYGFKIQKKVFPDKVATISAWKMDGWDVAEGWNFEASLRGFILTNPKNGERYWIADLRPLNGKNIVIGVQMMEGE